MEVNDVAVMRRRKDSWLNATQILKVAGIEKGKRTKVLEKEILIGEHEKVQGGYGKYQGTWIKFERGLEFCRQYGVEELLRPLLTYDMGQGGGVAGRGGIDTPTKEQAMAAQRKRLYNNSASDRAGTQSGTFFKNISTTASHAVAAISKARFDSPVPRIRGSNATRPPSFSRQSSSQQILGSQESVFPGGSQQSMQSYASVDSFAVINGHDTVFASQPVSHFSHDDSRNGDFEEPPRKRIRPSPSVQDSQPIMNGDYYSVSMREPSPTEPNESFVYHPQANTAQAEEVPMPLMPLPIPTSQQGRIKKALLMSLFTDPYQTDFSTHEAFRTLSAQELDMPIDNTAHTALHWAATLARLPLLKALILRGASIFRVNRGGETALMRACVVTNNLDNSSFPDILELLGPSIELLDSRGRTVLHHIAITSAVKGRSQASKYYLESILEFVVRQGQGSASNSQQSFTDGLLAVKSMGIGRFMSEIVNIQDKSGDTALLIAARIGNRSIISQLLEVGADPSLSNRSNLCPIDFGIGDPTDAEGGANGVFGDVDRTNKETRESSGEIITCKLVSFRKKSSLAD
jgi:regulatory protein SWI6